MNRAELIERIASSNEMSRAAADRLVDSVFQAIIESVRSGDGLSIVGFGTFKSVDRAARTARNPATGEEIKVAARKVPKFVPGSAFKAALDPKAGAKKAAAKGGGAKGAAGKGGGAKAAGGGAKKAAAAKKKG